MKKIVIFICLAAVAVSTVQAQSEATWVDSVKLKGDLRYRHEYIDDDSKDVDRHRQRIRARVGLSAEVNEELKAGIQLASGEEDPVSSNQTLDDAFTSKGINLDLAYFTWAPEAMSGLELTGGKMKQPWIAVGDLIWDGDLNPEGLAVNASFGGDAAEFLAHGGGFWVDEISGSDDDAMLYSGQLALKLKPSDDLAITFGGSYYYYDNIEEGTTALVDPLDSFGNTVTETTEEVDPADPLAVPVVTSVEYMNGFKNYEAFVEVSIKTAIPVKLFADYVVNDDADDDDTGYQVGLSLGKAKDPGSFEFSYNYRSLEANAVLGAFSDSDFAGGGTNGEGHKLGGKYQIAKNWQLGATCFLNQKDPDGADVDYTRVQIDLAAKF